MGVELGEIPAACLAVEHGDDLHGGLSGGDVRVAGAAVADDADVLLEVDGVHLGQLAHARNGFQNAHSHCYLDIALHRTGHPLLDEHGESGDEHAVQHPGLALGKAVIMGGDKGDVLILHPLLEGHHVLCHLPDLFDGAAALNVEGVQNVLGLGPDGLLVSDIICDGPHLFPVELLGVQPHPMIQVGLVDIQVHHAGVGPSDLGQVGIPETAAHLGGFTPVLDLRLDLGVAPLHHAGDDGVALSGPLQVGHHLAHRAAGVQLAQPGGGVGVLIVGGQLLLEVHQHHGHVEITHGGQHIVGRGVGQELENDQIHVGGPKLVPRRLGQLLGGDDAAVDELHGAGQRFLEIRILPLELGNQGRELRQIRPQSDGEHAHSGLCVD